MYGINTLLPTRFLLLLAHLCISVTLLWDHHSIMLHCSPMEDRLQSPLRSVPNQLIAGFSMTIALIIIELITFITGLTMFSSTACLVSAICHGTASLLLTYFVMETWACNWFWFIFFLGSVIPSAVDLNAALMTDTEKPLVQGQPVKTGGWTFWLISAAVVTTCGSSLPVGYNIGVVNSPADIIKGFCNESLISRYNLNLSPGAMDILWSSIVSVFIVGGVTGSLLGALLADHFGRKGAVVIVNILSIVASVMFLFSRAANSVEMIIIGRAIVGLSAGLTTCVVPMYLAELAPARLTGALGVICPMGVNFGVLAGQVMGMKVLLGDVNDWPYLLACYGLLVVVSLPLLFFLPESPKYLYVVKEETEMATRELCRVRGVSRTQLSQELFRLQQEMGEAADTGRGGGLLQVWRSKELRLPLLLACTMQAGQQTSGINAVFYYSTSIFMAAGLSRENAGLATIGAGFINCVTAVLSIYLLSRCGRRMLFLVSTATAAATLFCLALVTKLGENIQWMAYLCIVAVLLYVFIYGFGLGPIPYFIASELFEVGTRPAGMAWGSLSNWGGNFLVGMTFPTLKAAIGPYSFLIFGSCTTALFVFQYIYFPETHGRTPAQVALLCKDGFKSRPPKAIISML